MMQLEVPCGEMTIHRTTQVWQDALRTFFQASTHAARPADGGSGQLRRHLVALHVLHEMYREPMSSGLAPPLPMKGDPIQLFAPYILNRELVPFLTRWHPRLASFEREHPDRAEEDWEQYEALRESLRTLQRDLYPQVIGLGRIAGIPEPARHLRHFGWQVPEHP